MHSMLRAASSSAKAVVRMGPPQTAKGLMLVAMVTASARAATGSSDAPVAVKGTISTLRPYVSKKWL